MGDSFKNTHNFFRLVDLQDWLHPILVEQMLSKYSIKLSRATDKDIEADFNYESLIFKLLVQIYKILFKKNNYTCAQKGVGSKTLL